MIRKMEAKVKTIYVKPLTEVFTMEKAPFVMVSADSDAGTSTWGGDVNPEEAKGFFSWSYEEREGIQSDKLTTDWE